MKYFIIKIKHNNGENEQTKQICAEADTYGIAEQVGYKWAEENLDSMFHIDSVVKSQIKEFHNEDDSGLFFFLVKYEFGLEAKPEKSNVLVMGDKLNQAYDNAFEFLSSNCDGLFIPEVKKQDIEEYVPYSEVKSMLGIVDEKEVEEEVYSL